MQPRFDSPGVRGRQGNQMRRSVIGLRGSVSGVCFDNLAETHRLGRPEKACQSLKDPSVGAEPGRLRLRGEWFWANQTAHV